VLDDDQLPSLNQDIQEVDYLLIFLFDNVFTHIFITVVHALMYPFDVMNNKDVHVFTAKKIFH
jgi:hypothetical protein